MDKIQIKVNYEYSDNLNIIKDKLNNLPEIISADFETANKYTIKEIEELKNKESDILKNNIFQQINADGLSHPSLSRITHLSIGWSDSDSFVCIVKDKDIENYIYEYLTTTDRKQIWHNCCFDFIHIFYNTHKLPLDYEDTYLISKCIRNNTNNFKSKCDLKFLMGSWYGKWAEEKDAEFKLEDMYNPTMIKYSATDACATFKLYETLTKYFK